MADGKKNAGGSGNETRFRLRIRYSKTGRLRYLSHLETMRCLERSIRRAQLPFLVSQGFSPHMRTSFGWALPVGVASRCEYIDVLLGEYIDPERVRSMLSGSMPAGMEVLDVCYVDPSSKSLEEEFPYSSYVCVFEWADGGGSAGDAAPAASDVAGDATGDADTRAVAGDASDASADAAEREFAYLLSTVQSCLDTVLKRGNMVVRRKKKEKVVEFDKLLCGVPALEVCEGKTDAGASDAGAAGAGGFHEDGPYEEVPFVKMSMTTFTEGKGSLRPDLFCAEIVNASGGANAGTGTNAAEGGADADAGDAGGTCSTTSPRLHVRLIERTAQSPEMPA